MLQNKFIVKYFGSFDKYAAKSLCKCPFNIFLIVLIRRIFHHQHQEMFVFFSDHFLYLLDQEVIL